MKVIVAGFIKTGTKSMAAALDILGYQVYDLEHHFYYLGDDWLKIMNGRGSKDDFRRMYENVDAGCDVPFSFFWEEIMEAFPDAKIVFMQKKDEHEWERSMRKQVEAFNANLPFLALSVLSTTGNRFFRYMRVMNRVMFGNPKQWPWQAFNRISSSVARKRYRDHCCSVLNRAPKDKLLVFNLADGWEPLCEFLGKDIPKVPFPHENVGGKLVEDWMKKNPLFGRMQKEMYFTIAIFSMLVSFVAYRMLLQ